MFKRADSVVISSRAQLRNKEAKLVKEMVSALFPVRLADLDALLPLSGKGTLEALKFASKMTGYALPEQVAPLFVDIDTKGQNLRLVPTLLALWACPTLLPVILIPSPVSVFVVGGADLMLPGCLRLPTFAKGALVAVRVAGNPCAIAVGEALLSSADAQGEARMRGRVLKILLHFGDALWDSGGRVRPNAGFTGNVVEPTGDEPCFEMPKHIADELAASAAAAGAPAATEAAGAGAGADEAPWWTQLDATELLRATLLQAIKRGRHVRQADLPMLANVFYGDVMVKGARPRRAAELDPKRTPWKKTSVFLRAMEAEGVLALSEERARDGSSTLRVVSVDRQHPLVRAHRAWPAAEEAGGAGGGGGDDEDEGSAAGGSASSAAAFAAVSGAAAYVPPTLTLYLRPPRAAHAVVNTVNAALGARGLAAKAAGVVLQRGRRGGPAAQLALNTALVRAGELFPAQLQSHSGTSPAPAPATVSTASSLDSPPTSAELSSSSSAPSSAPFRALLSALPPAGALLLTRAEAAQLLLDYVALRGLSDAADKRNIRLDSALAAALGMEAGAGAPAPAAPGAAAPTAADGGSGGGGGDEGEDEGEAEVEGDGRELPPCVAFSATDAAASLLLPAASLGPLPSVSRESAAQQWLRRMEHWHALTHSIAQRHGAQAAAEVTVRRGDPATVLVSVRRLQGGRRASTHVLHADRYQVDLAELGKGLQRHLSAAACVQPCAANPRLSEVMVQGDEAARVRDFLVGEMGLPRDFVVVGDGEGGKGKGGGGRG